MSKVTKSLIESCKRLKDKNLLTNKQYDECRVLDKKEKWLQIDSKKKVVLKLTTNRGIYNYVDENGKIHRMEDIMNSEKN